MSTKNNLQVEFNHVAFHYAQNFAKRWLGKVVRKGKDEKSWAFDRFIAYYVAYAALVKVIKPEKNKYSHDTEYCTGVMVNFIIEKSSNLEKLIDELNVPALELANVIKTYNFSVVSSASNNKAPNDPNLLTNWKNDDVNVKLLALFQTLYYLRCNIFHGAKEYDACQIDLLTPASECVKIIGKEILAIYSKMYWQE